MEKEDVVSILKTIYDPEFPFIDIYTMWLIYEIKIEAQKINIVITFTSPSCPMTWIIFDMVKNSVWEKYKWFEVNLDITFEPPWNPDMIKDPEIKELFNI